MDQVNVEKQSEPISALPNPESISKSATTRSASSIGQNCKDTPNVRLLSSDSETEVETDNEVESEQRQVVKEGVQTSRKYQFQCTICGKGYQNCTAFRKHQKCHEQMLLNCTACDRTFKSKGALKEHFTINHLKVKKYACKLCDFKAVYSSQLRTHEITHCSDADSLLTCSFCHKKLSSLKYLRLHVKRHTGEKVFRCTTCPMRLISRAALNSHMQTHKATKDIVCEKCGKMFKNDGNLRWHQAIHNEKKFSCEICGKMFVNKHRLNLHLLVHTGEKPFQCDLCQKSFAKQSNLSLHLRMHNNERPYACDVCDKTFYNASNMKTHKRSHLTLKQRSEARENVSKGFG